VFEALAQLESETQLDSAAKAAFSLPPYTEGRPAALNEYFPITGWSQGVRYICYLDSRQGRALGNLIRVGPADCGGTEGSQRTIE
jgi:hypothetical protein